MKCKKCKENIENNLKFCPRCGTKVKHTGRRIVASLLILAILVGVAGFAGWKTGWLPFGKKNTNPAAEDFSLLTGSFTDRKITNQESALAAIGDVADDLGIEDVNAEFSECKVDTVSGNTYYRFYQEYQGIPVYGRSVVIAADETGNSVLLTGNYVKIEKDLSIESTVTADSVLDSIMDYVNAESNLATAEVGFFCINDEELVIYESENVEATSAYNLVIPINAEPYRFVIDATNARILLAHPLTYTDNVSMKYDIDGERYSIDFWSENGEYQLYDKNRNLKLYTANGEILVINLVFKDPKGNEWIYNPNNEQWKDIKGNVIELSYEDKESLKLERCIFDTDEKEYGVFPVVSQTTDFEHSAIKMMAWIEGANDFYYRVLKRCGWSGTYDNMLRVVYNCENGSYSYTVGAFSMLSLNSDTQVDVVAHELTHSVEQSESGMTYKGESGAIMEALSDIFGELCEDWYDNKEMDGSCDWRFHNGVRDIINPQNSTEANTPHPSTYQGDSWIDISDPWDHGGVHINSTVISHAAYLMYTGIGGGNPNFEALTTEDLAHLFYETLFTLPSDCTFSQFRTLVQNTAEMMYKQGRPGFSYKKVRSVSNAFFQVGIDPDVTPVSKKELSLDVYDIDGQPYNNYTLYVRNYSGAEKKYSGKVVAAEGISFPSTGGYELTIEDNANTDNRTTFKVQAIDTIRATKLPVFTRCGSGNTTPFGTYIEAANRTTATGSWTEDIHMTAKMVVKKGNSTTKTKATMEASVDIEGWNGTDTSSLYMSGSASTSVLNQEIAYTMTWQNGMAHYEYTKPTVSSADLEIDPSYFNFNSLTDDMIISSAMTGNHITFSVKGDALTKSGISAVNDLLSGVENLSYDDAMVNVTLNEQSGKIDMLTMTFRASMNYQGYDIEADYENHYVFSENDIQSEGDSIALLDGYWENMIQCYEDGSVNEYDPEPMAEVISENLSYNYTLCYQLDGKKLVIDWGEGFKTTSEPVTMDFPINDENWNDSNIYFTYGLLNKS